MKKICLIILIVGLITIPVVCGALDNPKVPDGFNKNSEYFYSNGDYGLTIAKHDADVDKWVFTNDTDYTVQQGNDHVWKYTDKLTKQVGVLEITDDNMLVEVYCNGSDTDKCYDYLMEFNKLNNVQPLKT